MLRIIRSIHIGEIVTLTVVASLVLIFGLSTNAWAETTTRAAKCSSLLFNEVSGWFCEKSNHCRSKNICIPPTGPGLEFRLTKDLEIKVRNRGNGRCQLWDSRCPGWLDWSCSNTPIPSGVCLDF